MKDHGAGSQGTLGKDWIPSLNTKALGEDGSGEGGSEWQGAFARKTQVCSASWPGKQEPTHNLCRVCVNIYYSLPSSLWLPAHRRP